MFDALACLLCLKLCQHNWGRPNSLVRFIKSTSTVLICKDGGNYAGIILARNYYSNSYASIFVNTKPANESFQNSIGADRYTLIE